jgi:hypothetical protein
MKAPYLTLAELAFKTLNIYTMITSILLCVASIIIGLVMLKGVFGKHIGYLVIAAGILTLFSPFGVILKVPVIIPFIGFVLTAVWQIVVGAKLYKLVTLKIPDTTESPYIKTKKRETKDLLKEHLMDVILSKNWFFALWQGERPLWEAWWVLGGAIYLGYFFSSLYFLMYDVYSLRSSPTLAYYYFGFVLFYFFLQIFFCVAVWRCAPNASNKVWFYLARILALVAAWANVWTANHAFREEFLPWLSSRF